MSESALDPVEVDATFTDRGHLQLTDASAAKIAAQLGHDRRPGDVVHLSVRRAIRDQSRGSGRPGERGALAHLAHLADDFGTEDIRAVREEMTVESEWTRGFATWSHRFGGDEKPGDGAVAQAMPGG